jgi:homoserine O-acetyltransferase
MGAGLKPSAYTKAGPHLDAESATTGTSENRQNSTEKRLAAFLRRDTIPRVMRLLARGCLFIGSWLFFSIPVLAQEQKFASLGEFKLESGEMIHDCRVGYRTFGKLNADGSNAILFPTWANGTTDQLQHTIGPRTGVVDYADYFVILIDALANGVSSSPSNSAAQPRMKFPKITVRDMVNSQYQVATGTLGLRHLKAVVGTSMGGMQTFQWMVSYPEFMDKAVPIVGSPRLAPYDLLHWQAEIDAIETNPAWNHGDYTENPSRLLEFEYGEMLLNTPTQYNRTHTREQVFESLAKAKDAVTTDANNKIRQVEAMMGLDVSDHFGGSMERAAAAVKAKVFVIVDTYDHVVTPEPARKFAALLHAPILELDSDCGHLGPSCEDVKVSAAVAAFLQK